MVKDCKVLLAVAGPFGSYGQPVVDACVRCDLPSLAGPHNLAKPIPRVGTTLLYSLGII